MDVRPAPSPSTDRTSSRDRAAAAPARLLWLDAVRAAALFVVIVGHYLMAILHLPAGATDLTISSLLDEASWTHPLTWALQVMGVFFAVGGYAAAGSVDRHEVTTWAAWSRWMTVRARGLALPTLPLLAVWLLAGPTLAARFGGGTVAAASAAALIPLWFLATYLLVQAAVPLWTRLIDRSHLLPTAAALLVTVALVDIAHLGGVPGIGYVNFAAVWSLPTLLGVAVARGRLTTPQLCTITAAGLGIAVSLVAWFGYIVPVVGVTGTGRSNNSPPSLLLAFHAIAYAAAVLAVAPRLERHLGATRGRRTVIDAAATWSMPLFLYHMTGLVILVAVELVADVPGLGTLLAIDPVGGTWWATRPLFIIAALVPTGILLAAAHRPTAALLRTASRQPIPHRAGVVLGVLGCATGIGSIILSGVATTPWTGVALLAGGLLALHRPALEAR